jgi:hypothetical protein
VTTINTLVLQLTGGTYTYTMFLLCGCGTGSQPTRLRSQDNNGGGGAAAFTFLWGRPRWNRPDMRLTYAVSPLATADHLPRDAVREAFRSALARWAEVTPLRFAEAARYEEADIRVGFYLHTADGKCDACGCVCKGGGEEALAHAHPPQDGRIHLHAARKWAVTNVAGAGGDAPPLAVDLESVAVHEIGHALGLGHSSSESSMMYRHYRGKVSLTDDDVKGVQELYGAKPPRVDLTADSKPKRVETIREIEQHIQQKKETAKKKPFFWRLVRLPLYPPCLACAVNS